MPTTYAQRVKQIAQEAAKKIDETCVITEEIKKQIHGKPAVVGVNVNYHIKAASIIIENAIRMARPTIRERLRAVFAAPEGPSEDHARGRQ